MGSKKGSDKTPYIDYHLSFHMGFCAGPVDNLVAVYMKEKLVFENLMSGGSFLSVDKQDLFGGNQREGGVAGDVHFMDGHWMQLAPEPLATRLGLTPATCPAFRDIASLVFVGNEEINTAGFKVSANYPNVPSVWARFRRASWALDPMLAIIEHEQTVTEDGVEKTKTWLDSNPASVIYECLTDPLWGMGGDPASLDVNSFQQVAQTLFDEEFGISFIWTRQSTIESMVQEILTHIDALFFFNPRTGKGTLKLLRDDYDIDSLREIGPSNSTLLSFQRKLWGETVNEIVVSWTNPSTEESETITYQSPGNIAMQGAVVSEARNYYMVRSAALAGRLCARDIVSASYPLATAQIEVDRRQWDLLPGDVVKFSWPVEGYGIEMLLMRVIDVDYGTPADSKIRVEMIEDVFGLDKAEFIMPPTTAWDPGEQDPNSPQFTEIIPARFVSAPYPIIQELPFYEPDDDDYPIIVVAALVEMAVERKDMQAFNLWKPQPDAMGEEQMVNMGERNITPSARLVGALPKEARSTIVISDFQGKTLAPEVGMLVMFDGAHEGQDELGYIYGKIDATTYLVERALLDTVPYEWDGGTRLWFIGDSFNPFDYLEPLADTTLQYIIQAKTSIGATDLEDTVIQTTNRPARHYFPFRPANLKVDGVGFGRSDDSQNHNPRDWTFTVTWSNRHRMNEDVVLRKWDEGPTTPEPGQTTRLRINEGERNITGLHGNSHEIPVMETGQVTMLKIEAHSDRDEFTSMQAHSVEKQLYRKGYGSDYGYFFGGWPGAMGDLK